MISEQLAQVLQAERSELNRLFELYRRQYPGLDGPGFLSSFGFLADEAFLSAKRYCELFHPNHTFLPAQASDLVKTLFDSFLDLFARGLLGKTEQNTELELALAQLLAAFPHLLLEKTDPFIRCLSNAWLNVSFYSLTGAAAWKDKILRLSPLQPGYEEFRLCGTIAAWLSGLTRFREPALKALLSLPDPLFLNLFGLPATNTPPRREEFIEKLTTDPWADPLASWQGLSPKKIFYSFIGGYEDFNGEFAVPPLALESSDRVVIRSGDKYFDILADRFGAVLVPRGKIDSPPAQADCPVNWLDGQRLKIKEKSFSLDQVVSLAGNYTVPDFRLVPVSSRVFYRGTLYITSPLSYKVFILGFPDPAARGPY